MKSGKYIIFPVLFFSSIYSIHAQNVNYSGVPQAVIEGIHTRYPAGFLHKIKKRNGLFEATIYFHSKKSEAEFDSNGAWVKTVTYVGWKDLPDTVRTTFRKSNYWQWRMDQITKVEIPKKEAIYILDVKDVNPLDIDEFRPFHREQIVKISASGKLSVDE